METTERPAVKGPAPGTRWGLSGKLLVLTTFSGIIAEVLIYLPSIANFRYNWLNDKISAAYTAALVFQAAPPLPDSDDALSIPDTLARQILESIGSRAVAMKMGQRRRLLAAPVIPFAIDQDIDMRDMRLLRASIASFATIRSTENVVLLMIGHVPMGVE